MLPWVAVANSPPRNSAFILERGRALSCYKHASGNQSNCSSRTHAHTAAQNTSAPHQACSTTSHAPTICVERHDGFELALQPSHSLEEQEHSQPSAFQLEQQSASHKQQQQQQHTRKQQPLSWNVTVSYGELTKLAVAASVVPALLLAVDALVLVLDGNLATTPLAAAAAWQGPLRDLFSFTVLLSVFITCEPGAAAASAVSATGAALQMLGGPALPPLVACCTATALIAAAITVLLAAAYTKTSSNTLSRRIQSNSKDCKLQLEVALRALQQVLGVLGGGLLGQFLATLAPSASPPAGAAGIAWWLPVVTGAVAVLLAGKLIAASKNKKLMQLWTDWPAWSATLLLILQPLQQLVELSLQPLQPPTSAHQQVLLVLASGLMVPRALLQRELMWFTGTFCGASLSAGQLAVCAAQHWTQEWGSTAGLTDVSRGAMMLVTIAALLLICALLQAGWKHILAPTNGSIGGATDKLQCDADVGCMARLPWHAW